MKGNDGYNQHGLAMAMHKLSDSSCMRMFNDMSHMNNEIPMKYLPYHVAS